MVKNPFIQKRYKIIAKFIKAVVKGSTPQEKLQTLAIPAIKARKEIEEKYNLDPKLIYAGLVSFKLITVEELKEFLKVKNLATGNVDRSSKPIKKTIKKPKNVSSENSPLNELFKKKRGNYKRKSKADYIREGKREGKDEVYGKIIGIPIVVVGWCLGMWLFIYILSKFFEFVLD